MAARFNAKPPQPARKYFSFVMSRHQRADLVAKLRMRGPLADNAPPIEHNDAVGDRDQLVKLR